MNENANQNKEFENFDVDFDVETMEGNLSKQLADSFSDLSFLEEDRKNIANPESLGKTILDEVWKQFGNQIGLDITNETLIQKYDREHPETYDEIKDDIMKDKRYKDANNDMKKQQQAGTLKDTYIDQSISENEKANLDHTVSRKELFENQRRKQANLDTKDLANKKENLNPTNENLNKSKSDKSVDNYLKNRKQREADLIKQNERANKKIDESNLSEVDKRLQKEKNKKALQNKLDANDKLMKEADKKARKAINKEIAKGAVKEVGKKAGKDALKTVAVSALFSLLKEIMNGFIRFLKSQKKTFSTFLDEMKEAIKSFFSKIMNFIKTGASAFIGTIVSEIFGPIVSVFKKLASFIKQGVSSFMNAIKFLKDKNNKDKPFSVKVAQVGKIVTAGLTVGSAIILGEIFEKFLLTVPGMQTPLPLLGTLANIIGLFLGSLVSGLVGAIVINLIDKFLAKKQRSELTKEVIKVKNSIINTQDLRTHAAETKFQMVKERAMRDIYQKHNLLNHQTEESIIRLSDSIKLVSGDNENILSENSDDFAQMQKDLENLL